MALKHVYFSMLSKELFLCSSVEWKYTDIQAAYKSRKTTIMMVILLSMFLQIKEIRETNLSTNQEKSEMKTLKWKVEGDNGDEIAPLRGGPVDNSTLVVELGPMEIRTFLLEF